MKIIKKALRLALLFESISYATAVTLRSASIDNKEISDKKYDDMIKAINKEEEMKMAAVKEKFNIKMNDLKKESNIKMKAIEAETELRTQPQRLPCELCPKGEVVGNWNQFFTATYYVGGEERSLPGTCESFWEDNEEKLEYGYQPYSDEMCRALKNAFFKHCQCHNEESEADTVTYCVAEGAECNEDEDCCNGYCDNEFSEKNRCQAGFGPRPTMAPVLQPSDESVLKPVFRPISVPTRPTIPSGTCIPVEYLHEDLLNDEKNECGITATCPDGQTCRIVSPIGMYSFYLSCDSYLSDMGLEICPAPQPTTSPAFRPPVLPDSPTRECILRKDVEDKNIADWCPPDGCPESSNCWFLGDYLACQANGTGNTAEGEVRVCGE